MGWAAERGMDERGARGGGPGAAGSPAEALGGFIPPEARRRGRRLQSLVGSGRGTS